jgi:hypothetical protein
MLFQIMGESLNMLVATLITLIWWAHVLIET